MIRMTVETLKVPIWKGVRECNSFGDDGLLQNACFG
jgi:hypothetical protein